MQEPLKRKAKLMVAKPRHPPGPPMTPPTPHLAPAPPMTLGNMRELGVHHLIAFCLSEACRHKGAG
jgi:hypothetical protein